MLSVHLRVVVLYPELVYGQVGKQGRLTSFYVFWATYWVSWLGLAQPTLSFLILHQQLAGSVYPFILCVKRIGTIQLDQTRI